MKNIKINIGIHKKDVTHVHDHSINENIFKIDNIKVVINNPPISFPIILVSIIKSKPPMSRQQRRLY